jgi:hypothetical protein
MQAMVLSVRACPANRTFRSRSSGPCVISSSVGRRKVPVVFTPDNEIITVDSLQSLRRGFPTGLSPLSCLFQTHPQNYSP